MPAHQPAMPPHQSANQPLQTTLPFAPQPVHHAAMQPASAQKMPMQQAEPEAQAVQAVQKESTPCRQDAPHDLRLQRIGPSVGPIDASSAHVQARAWLPRGAQCRCGVPMLEFRSLGLPMPGSPYVNRLACDYRDAGRWGPLPPSCHPLRYPLLHWAPYRAHVVPHVQAGHAQAFAHERHVCWTTGEDCAPHGRVGASPPSSAEPRVSG